MHLGLFDTLKAWLICGYKGLCFTHPVHANGAYPIIGKSPPITEHAQKLNLGGILLSNYIPVLYLDINIVCGTK